MNTIAELLNHYDLPLRDCEDEWRSMVEEFQKVKSAMPSDVAQKREQEIVEAFLDFHTIEDVTDDEPVKTKKEPVKSTSKKKTKKSGSTSAARYEFDEESVMKKADDILEKLF